MRAKLRQPARRLHARRVLLTAAVLLCALTPAFALAASDKRRPAVTTGGVSHVRGTSVDLGGTVDPHGLLTTYYFVYGPTESYGFQTPPQTLEAKSEHIKVGVTVADFPSGYHYRLVASNAAGPKQGHDKKFSKMGGLAFKLPRSLTAIRYREGFTLTGTLGGDGNEHVTVGLQETPYPYLEAFGDIGETQQTGPGGSFTFHVASLFKSGKFRVVAKVPRPIYSSTVSQLVAPRVTLKVQRSAVRGLVRLYGTVTPAESGARVLFQMSAPARPGNSEKSSERTSRFLTQFSTVARRGTRAVSRFSLIVSVKKAGSYRAEVSLRKGPLTSGASSTVKLLAASAKHKQSG